MKTQNAANTVKYFTARNCRKANLKPAEISEGYWRDRKCFIYKDRLGIFQWYKKDRGVTLQTTTLSTFGISTKGISEYSYRDTKEGRDFQSSFACADEIDITLFQEKLDAIIKRADILNSGVLPEEESTEFVERIHKEVEVRQEALQGIVIPSNWVDLDYHEILRLGYQIEHVKKEIQYFNDRLKEFSECMDIAQKTYIIGRMSWQNTGSRSELLEQVQKLKALAEKEQET
jgi:hypothetical protein